MVVRAVRHNAARRVAPSYGFDLVPVVHQAWRAWWLDAAGQAFLLLVLITALTVDPGAVLTAACAVGICCLGRLILRHLPETARLRTKSASAQWLRRSLRNGDRERHRELSRLIVVSVAGCVLLLEIGEVAAAEQGSVASGVLAAAVILLLLLCGSAAIAAVRQVALNRTRWGPLRPARLGRRLAAIEQQQACSYVVYHKPPPDDGSTASDLLGWDRELTRFIGSGKLVHRWLPPLGVQLLRPGEGSLPDREYQSSPFKAHELVDHLKQAMWPVGDGDEPTRLPGFLLHDRLYIAETDVPAERGFLRRQCTAEEVRQVIDNPHGLARHYLEIQISGDGGVVTTIFLRVTIRGRTLSLDFSACALTRTPLDYQVIEQYAESGAGAVARAAALGAVSLPQTIGAIWRLAQVPLMIVRWAWSTRDWTVIPRRGLLIGTRLSIREEKAEQWDDAELDKITIYDDMKIIEQRILKATEDFLEDREVDTSIFRRRVFNIINSGVLNMGKLEMGQAAVGAGAQFHHNAAGSTDSQDQPADGAMQ